MTDFEKAAEKLETNEIDKRGYYHNPEAARRTIQVGRILQIVQDIADNPKADPEHRLSASKILLDKSLPSLSSMDVTVMRDDETDDPAKLKATLAMLVEKAGPALLSEILGERAKQLPVTIEQKPVEVGDAEHIDPQKQRNTGS